jgi:eukaryotic-like serine/threonine-protein kinase
MIPAPRRRLRSSVTGVRGVLDSTVLGRIPYAPGDRVDKYELVRPLGVGGMGALWVAHDMVLDVHVAIKLMSLQGTSEEAKLHTQRLLEEARAAARLGHPSIVRVIDFGQTSQGDPFIAMELLDGEDLACVLERDAKVPPVDAVQVLLPIAHALATAHEKGIVHRDVKPENIFLMRAEVGVVPKLLDFGIARRVDNPSNLTQDGMLLGTPDYMSPEQARGADAATHTDQWSFCVVLYELLSGRVPFRSENYNALLRAIIEEEPKTLAEIMAGDPAGDPDLSQVIERGLKKDPGQRWGSMRELGEALAHWLLARGIGEDCTGKGLKRTWLREEQSGRLDVSRLPAMLAEAGAVVDHSVPGSGPKRISVEVVQQAPTSAAQKSPSIGPQLEAIAEMNKGGDPVELLNRAARRKGWTLAITMTLFVAGAVLGVLVATGIVVLR